MLESIQALDGAILLWIQAWLRLPILDGFFSFFTQLGNAGLIWISISLVLLVVPKTRKAGVWTLAALLLGVLCTNVLLKHLVGRPRPWLVVEGLTYLVQERDPLSFPSGHTCAAFAAGGLWARMAQRRWVKAVCLGQAFLMGYSRLHVGVHFPTDVLAGMLIGFACSQLVWYLSRRAAAGRGEGRCT